MGRNGQIIGARIMTFQPYQEASEEIKRQQEAPGKILKKAAILAPSVVGAGSIATRALPFLSQYIPENIMQKGLSKIDPRFGKFITGAQNAGHAIDDIKDFLKEKIEPSEEGNKEKPPEQRNIIQKYSDNLYEYMRDMIEVAGNTPQQAAIKAKKFQPPKFQKIMSQIEKDYKSDWVSIVESIFGKGDMGQQAQQQPQAQPMQPQTQSQAQPQGGNADQQLLAAMQKILQM
jgi:hypothetical protein